MLFAPGSLHRHGHDKASGCGSNDAVAKMIDQCFIERWVRFAAGHGFAPFPLVNFLRNIDWISCHAPCSVLRAHAWVPVKSAAASDGESVAGNGITLVGIGEAALITELTGARAKPLR